MRSRRQSFQLILALGILNALTPFTIDLYLPAFPSIARELGTDVARMSLTVSVYFIGFAFGQVFYGPVLDRFGRKLPVYFGLLIYILATLGCMTARSFEVLVAFRFLAALGGCSASVATMSMVRDYFPAKDGGKILSNLMLVLSVSPLVAPSVGSMMVEAWGWRALFGTLMVLASLDLVLVKMALPVGYEPDPSVSLRIQPILRTFLEILREPQFRNYTLAGSLSFTGLFVFIAGAPAVFMDGFGVSAKLFGGVFAILAGGMIGGGQLNHILLRVRDGVVVFRAALVVQVIVGAVFLLAVLLGQPGLWGTVGLLFVFLLCAGIAYPNAAALALAPLSKNIGSASALLGFLQLGLGSLAAAILGVLNFKGPLPMALVMSVCSVLALLLAPRAP